VNRRARNSRTLVDRRTGEAAYAHRAVVTEDAAEDIIRSVRGVRRRARARVARRAGDRPRATDENAKPRVGIVLER